MPADTRWWRAPRSLRVWLPLVVGGLAVASVTATALTAGWLGRHSVEQQVQHRLRAEQLVDDRIARLPPWPVSPEELHAAARELASRLGSRVVFTDPAGNVLADSAARQVPARAPRPYRVADARTGASAAGQPVTWRPGGPVANLDRAGPRTDLPTLYAELRDGGLDAFAMIEWTDVPANTLVVFADGVGDPFMALPEFDFYAPTDRTLAIAAVAAALIAVTLAVVVAHRILRPVVELTQAAQQLQRGHRIQPLRVTGDELGTLAHAFNTMAAARHRQERLRKTMVADIAHELRTPLNNLTGWLDALRDRVAEPSDEVLSGLQEEAQRLSRLVDDLAELNRSDTEGFQLRRQPTDLAALLHQAARAADARAAAKGVALHTEAAPGLLAEVDPERFGQVLGNLLDNAITHTPSGGQVTLTATASSGGVSIQVRDTGPGIVAEHLPDVFERLWRGDPSRSRATGGYGLGLAIAHQIVTAHHGTITTASTPGAGATFTVTLPAPGAAPGATAARSRLE